jgi:hypothetical protein
VLGKTDGETEIKFPISIIDFSQFCVQQFIQQKMADDDAVVY